MESSLKIIKMTKYLITILLIISNLTIAQEDVDENRDRRTLGEHYFTISNTLGSPFVLTSLNISLGFGGINDLKYAIPSRDEDESQYLQGDLTLMLFSFGYQHAIKDWLAVYFDFEIISRMGSDHITLFKEGINYSSSFNVGWLIKILRYDDFALSSNIKVTNGLYSIISIENFADEINSGNEDASLIVDYYSTSAYATLNAAYGFSKLLGLNGDLGMGYGETIQKYQSNEFYMSAGIELDMNFTEYINAPISVILGYRFNSFPENSTMLHFNRNVLFGQICYIGRPDFIISLDFKLSKEDSGDSVIWPNTMEFSMRYLF